MRLVCPPPHERRSNMVGQGSSPCSGLAMGAGHRMEVQQTYAEKPSVGGYVAGGRGMPVGPEQTPWHWRCMYCVVGRGCCAHVPGMRGGSVRYVRYVGVHQ